MASYDPPRVSVPIFNPSNYTSSGGISLAFADGRYVQLVKGSQSIVGNIAVSGSLSSNVIRVTNGSALSPSVSFTSANNYGMWYNPVTPSLNLSVGGSNKISIGTASTTVADPTTFNSTVTLPDALGFNFAGSSTTGIGFSTGQMELRVANSNKININTNSIDLTQPIIITNGTVANPGLAFTTTNNTGLSFVGSSFNIGYGGTARIVMSPPGTAFGPTLGGTPFSFIRRIAPTSTITVNSNTNGTITIPIGVTLLNTNYDVHINILNISDAYHITFSYDTLTTTNFRVLYNNNGSGSADFQIQCTLYGF